MIDFNHFNSLTSLKPGKWIYLCLVVLLLHGSPRLIAQETVFSPVGFESAKAQTLGWVKKQKADSKKAKSIEKKWEDNSLSPDELTDLVINTFQMIDPDTKRFLEKCIYGRDPFVPQASSILNRKEMGEFYRANLGFYYGRYLSRRELYDDALAVLKSTDVKQVIDPASYFFYLAICQHRLFMKKECLETIDQLLENTEQVPDRYKNVAQLMKYELEQIKEKSIGEISHKMGDSRRRLDLGHGGPKTRKVQDDIIALLDELIKKKEEQSSSSSSSSSSGGQQSGDMKPAEESRVKGSTAPGNVDEKKRLKQGGWGGLPPKEQAKAKSMINRQFPAHYREAVEKYFKKLATRRAEPKKTND